MQNVRSILISLSLLVNLPGAIVYAESKPPKNVIIMIADGFSPAGATLARYVKGGKLNLDSMLTGTVQTRSANSLVTDSAAAGTAYATGKKTNNGFVSVAPDQSNNLTNLMEAAKQKNMSIGIVVTDKITGATPASFSAHAASRQMKHDIATQQINAGFDVLFGGGRKYFLPKSVQGNRKDNLNLLNAAQDKGINVITTYDELQKLSQTPVLGLFSMERINYEIDRTSQNTISLKNMSAKALDLLKTNPNGFVLMIEGSRIDHAAHDNDAAAYAKEIISYDDTIALVKDFIDKNPDTLLISVADHDTGGVTVGRDVKQTIIYKYSPEILNQVQHSMEYLNKMLENKSSLDEVIAASGLKNLYPDEVTKIKKYEVPLAKLLKIINQRSRTGWTTLGHSAIDTNLYAYGQAREEFMGNLDNTDIANKIAKMLDLDLGNMKEAM